MLKRMIHVAGRSSLLLILKVQIQKARSKDEGKYEMETLEIQRTRSG